MRVKAAGVNPVEAAAVAGYLASMLEHRFPFIPGVEFSGEVIEPGGGFEPGDEVYGSPDRDWFGEGTWAELLRVAPEQIARKPGKLDHAQASGVPTAGLTALEGIEAAGLEPGATIVIVGATGGVGSYAAQLAAGRGLQVIAVGRGSNAEYARELGAAETIDYAAGDVAQQFLAAHPEGVDAVYDTYSDTAGLVALAPAVKGGGPLISPKGAADADTIGATGRTANRCCVAATRTYC